MLITTREIIDLAYITNIDDNLIKEEVISMAEHTYIKPVLTPDLYTDVSENPGSYTILIDNYIKPCLAFYIKYLLYSQQLFETAAYSTFDPSLAQTFIDQTVAPLIHTYTHNRIIHDILFIAKQKEAILIEFLESQSYQNYEKPESRRISGILIKSDNS